MPLTPAHLVAVFPLRRPLGRFGVFSALLIGSAIPDLEYFLPLLDRSISPSVPGLFLFCLPAGLAMYWLVHRLFLPLCVELLPDAVRARLAARDWSTLPSSALLPISISILIGASTHIVWDTLTHASGIAWVPALGIRLVRVDDYVLTGYGLAQHASTFFGLALLGIWLRRWLVTTPARHDVTSSMSPALRRRLRLLVVVPAVTVGLGVAIPSLFANISPLRTARLFAGIAVIGGGRTFIVMLVVLSAWWRAQARTEP